MQNLQRLLVRVKFSNESYTVSEVSEKYGWTESQTRRQLNKLVSEGLLTKRTESMEYELPYYNPMQTHEWRNVSVYYPVR